MRILNRSNDSKLRLPLQLGGVSGERPSTASFDSRPRGALQHPLISDPDGTGNCRPLVPVAQVWRLPAPLPLFQGAGSEWFPASPCFTTGRFLTLHNNKKRAAVHCKAPGAMASRHQCRTASALEALRGLPRTRQCAHVVAEGFHAPAGG